MVVTKVPPSLNDLCLRSLCKAMLQQWKNTFFSNYYYYLEQFSQTITVSIPHTFHDQVFELMVDSHARFLQKKQMLYGPRPSISALVNSIVSSSLQRLNLQGLRHIGTVEDEEIQRLQDVLLHRIPYLDNLIEISLHTSGEHFTLPICTDEILEKIGSSCSKLASLDVSYNHNVTDEGLRYLLPSCKYRGCPKLVKISLFECSVSDEGIVLLLKGLPKLKFLGYRETGQSLWFLPSKEVQPLELAHINNLGNLSRNCKTFKELECNSALVNIMSTLCPKLNGLKVRVKDSEVKLLLDLTITILALVYNIGNLSSPGTGTVQYLQQCGAQLVELSFVCQTFSYHLLKTVCEQCLNLKCLYIKSVQFNCVEDVSVSDKNKCVLTNLEEFKFTNGLDISDHCNIPTNIFNYVLHKSYVLREIVLSMRNILLSDHYIEELFSSIETSKIKTIGLLVPCEKYIFSPENLTMMTVETLIAICPELEELGTLTMWDVSLEEIKELKRQLKFTNSALVIK